jgi:Coenzyme PQQ synthesis protein D (PqqD)
VKIKLPNAWAGNVPGRAPSATPSGVEQRDGKKRKRTPSRRELLALRPLRNSALEWAVEEDQVVLEIKRVSNWKTKLLNIFVPLPESRRVMLDPIGSDVWQMLDGQTTIEYIGKALAKKHKLTPREAELSLQQFFKELSRRGYVGFVEGDARETGAL